MANFAAHQPSYGRAKNLGVGETACHTAEILQVRLRAQNGTPRGLRTTPDRAHDETAAHSIGRIRKPLFDDDRAFHVGMELAEVVERPGRVECLGERFAWGDGARLQRLTIEAGRRVGSRVVIRPGHAAADGNGNLGWVEGKILDRDGKGFRGRVSAFSCAWRGLLCRFGAGAARAGRFDEVDGYPRLVTFRAEPGDTGMPGVVQLA